MEKQIITKKQHYIPKFYLKNFCNEKGSLIVYDPKYRNYSSKTPAQICYADYLYETAVNDGFFLFANDIEKQFSKNETVYANTISKILLMCKKTENANALICSSKDKDILIRFVANLYLRNPLSLCAGVRCNSDSCQVNSNKPDDDLDRFLPGISNAISEFAEKVDWLDERLIGGKPHKLINDLNKLHYCFLTSQNKRFIISSFPTILQINSKKELKLVITPLSPYCVLIFSDLAHYKAKRNKTEPVPDIVVDEINKMYYPYLKEKPVLLLAKEKQDIETVLNMK